MTGILCKKFVSVLYFLTSKVTISFSSRTALYGFRDERVFCGLLYESVSG
jgi:hypothetical protein